MHLKASLMLAGLFEWSMKHQDGTKTDTPVQPIAKEDRAWYASQSDL